MCTLALYLQQFGAYPLVVAANRDEFYERPTLAPQMIAYDPWVVAGQDLVAGGTWLGMNESGMIVGLLNRRQPGGAVDPTRRSRGLLALEMLQCRSPGAALEQLQHESGERYNGFNLLVATANEAYVAHNADQTIAVTPLTAGVHLLTNLALNDPTCPRIAKSARLFESVAKVNGTAEALISSLQPILADHSTPLDPRTESPNNLCVHNERFGTCSASILFAGAGGCRYLHAAGPPCRIEFREILLPR